MAEKISEEVPANVRAFLAGIFGNSSWFVKGDTYYSDDPDKIPWCAQREVSLGTTEGINGHSGRLLGALAEVLYWRTRQEDTYSLDFVGAVGSGLLVKFTTYQDTSDPAYNGVRIVVAPHQGEEAVPEVMELLTEVASPDGECSECGGPRWDMYGLPEGLEGEDLCFECVRRIQEKARRRRIEDWGDESLYSLEGWYYIVDSNRYAKF